MKIKKILLLCLMIGFFLTGCFKRDNMDNIKIYTTTYPIEYMVNEIYGFNSVVDSIYPNGVKIANYKLTDKQIEEYSKSDMIVYDGLSSKEKSIAAKFLNNNDHIKVIDVSKGISLQNDEEELWLCPSNYLMLAQNVKNELLEYITSTVLVKEIENNYENLKLTVSKYDAELKLIAENSNNKTIIAGNNVFEFLEKYGYKVLNVEDDNEVNAAKAQVKAGSVSYVFVLDTDEESANVKALVDAGLKKVIINSMTNLSDNDISNGINYQSVIESLIDNIKMEVYN